MVIICLSVRPLIHFTTCSWVAKHLFRQKVIKLIMARRRVPKTNKLKIYSFKLANEELSLNLFIK